MCVTLSCSAVISHSFCWEKLHRQSSFMVPTHSSPGASQEKLCLSNLAPRPDSPLSLPKDLGDNSARMPEQSNCSQICKELANCQVLWHSMLPFCEQLWYLSHLAASSLPLSPSTATIKQSCEIRKLGDTEGIGLGSTKGIKVSK